MGREGRRLCGDVVAHSSASAEVRRGECASGSTGGGSDGQDRGWLENDEYNDKGGLYGEQSESSSSSARITRTLVWQTYGLAQ